MFFFKSCWATDMDGMRIDVNKWTYFDENE